MEGCKIPSIISLIEDGLIPDFRMNEYKREEDRF